MTQKLLQYQLKLLEEYVSRDSVDVLRKQRRKERQIKKESLREKISKERKEKIATYKSNVKIIQQGTSKKALVNKQQKLLQLLTQDGKATTRRGKTVEQQQEDQNDDEEFNNAPEDDEDGAAKQGNNDGDDMENDEAYDDEF